MSGISFKITAPTRPNGPTSTSSTRPPPPPSSRNNSSRHHQSSSSRHNAHDDSEEDSDEDGVLAGRDSKRRRLGKGEEEVVEFGRDGATAKHAKPAEAGPLVIPALPNKDWRRAAEELRAGRPKGGRKREIYLPEKGGGMSMGEKKSTTSITEEEADKVNAQEVIGGLEMREKKVKMEVDVEESSEQAVVEPAPAAPTTKAVETEEQKALRELLGEGATNGGDEGPTVEAIMSAEDARNGPIEEADAFKRDVDSRPDEASLEDYARVPVGAFGLAMLRGMGWQPGQAASRTGRGAIEAHVPSSRPALLGIGAKPIPESAEKGSGKNGSTTKPKMKSRREEMKFMPLIKQSRENGTDSGRNTPLPITDGSASSSRRPSRSPTPPSTSSRHRRDRSPRRDRDSRDDYRKGSSSSRRYEDDRRRSRYDEDDDRKSSRRYDDRDRDDRDRRGSSRRDDRDRDGGERERSDRSSGRDDSDRGDRDRDRDRGRRRKDYDDRR